MYGIICLGSLYFFFDFVYDPGHTTRKNPLKILFTVLTIVYVKVGFQIFRLGGIFIDFLFRETVNVLIIDIDLELIFWRRLVIDLDLLNGN